MRHRHNTVTLDRKAGPRKALLRNLAAQVIVYERIKTTEAKAKAVRPIVERIVTKAKVNSIANRRHLLKYLPTDNAVRKALEVLGPRYEKRPGGYMRIIKLPQRQGDAARMAYLEFVS